MLLLFAEAISPRPVNSRSFTGSLATASLAPTVNPSGLASHHVSSLLSVSDCVYLCLSVCLFLCLSLFLSVSLCLSVSVSLCLCLSVCLSLSLCLSLSFSLSLSGPAALDDRCCKRCNRGRSMHAVPRSALKATARAVSWRERE